MSDQPRRPRPMGAPPAPRAASPAIAVVLAILAAAVGFLILKQFDKDAKGGSASTEQPTDSSAATDSTAPTGSGAPVVAETTTTATPAPVDPATFQVIVVNASGVPGSAKALSSVLSAQAGLTVGTPANILDTVAKYDATKVYYITGAENQAAFVALKLNWGITPEALPAEPFVDSAAIGTASVIIALGKDRAQSALGGGSAASTPADAGTTSVQPPPGVTG